MKTLRACLLLNLSAVVRAQDATPEATEQPIEFPGPGSCTVRHRINGVERICRFAIPASYSDDGDPLPLVIALHGAGIESYSGFNALAEREGFSVVYPNGVSFELGLTSMDIDATEVIWSFFQAHSSGDVAG
jgi:poly(3-hydroxybutyrate) depolymerase